MITYLLVIIIIGIISTITSPLLILPNASLPLNVTASITSIVNDIHLVYAVAPVSFTTLFAVFAGIIVIENNVAIYKIIKWIYNKIPGVN